MSENKPSEQEQIDRDAAKAALHQLIDDLPFTADDLVFITVIVNGFWSVPPAALFQQLRSGDEQMTRDPQNPLSRPTVMTEKSS